MRERSTCRRGAGYHIAYDADATKYFEVAVDAGPKPRKAATLSQRATRAGQPSFEPGRADLMLGFAEIYRILPSASRLIAFSPILGKFRLH